MTTAVIVQARMGSSRLPGKVMLDLQGQTVLQHVLKRCKRVPGVDVVVCAVPGDASSAPIMRAADEAGATVFKGSEQDVLARYLGAARAVGADVVLRVTSDCPLIDPQVCGEVLALRHRDDADYACNNMPRSFPHGLDCEAFPVRALAEAAAATNDAFDHEHVTPWLRRAPHIRRANLPSGDASLATLRWTLDYPEDLQFFRALFAAAPSSAQTGFKEIVALLRQRPDIEALNASRSAQHATA